MSDQDIHEFNRAQAQFDTPDPYGFVTTRIPEYALKDSGKRQQFDSGMVRDITEGKINWSLVADGPMLKRYAIHLTKGAEKYAVRNWMKATGAAEYERFRESAFRHFMAWYLGEVDEDHLAATVFNLNGAAYVQEKMP